MPIDAPALPAGCDWLQSDHTNQQENIPVAYTGAPLTLCGQIDLQHGPAAGIADASYKQLAFNSTVSGEVVVRIDTASSVDGYHRVQLSLYQSGGGQLVGTHGVFVGPIQAGNHYLDLAAEYPTSVTAPITYRITIAPRSIASLCPTVTAPADYTESHDGASHDGNDVVRFATNQLAPTPSATDAPEPTAITAAAGSAHRLHGASDAVTPDASGLNDADTYAITTGAGVHELAIRADWTAPVALYTALYSTDLRVRELAPPLDVGPEVALVAVAPSTTYWLWVAGATSGGTTGLPAAYDVSLCAPAP